MDPSSFKHWREAPGTTFWVVTSFLMTVATAQHWGGLRLTKVNFHYRTVVKEKEYWRAITSALVFDKPGWLQAVVMLLVTFSLASQLERRLFTGRTLNYVANLALAAAMLHGPGFYLKELRQPFTTTPYAIFIASWFGFEFFKQPVMIGGMLSIPAVLLPVLMVGMRYIAEGQDLHRLKINLVGVAVGLIMKAICVDPQAGPRLRQERQRLAKEREDVAARVKAAVKKD